MTRLTDSAPAHEALTTASPADSGRGDTSPRSPTASASRDGLEPLFAPRSVAVIGAGRNRVGVGADVFHRLLTGGYQGRLVPINPHASVIEGIRAYRRITDVTDPVDLAIVAVPGACVSAVVDDCIASRVRSIVVISAGFGETGPAGAALEAALRDRVRAAGIRMIGPNCLGLLNTAPAVRLNATFAATLPPPGHVAFASQSGALGLAILAETRQLGIGISSFVSIGNAADVGVEDLIEYWGRDEHTHVILLYVEQLADPRRLRDIARRVSRTKPILMVKSGRSAAGAQASRSHTGALADDDRLVDAVCRDAGVIRVGTLQELFDAAAVLSTQPLPGGNRVAVLTNAGGPGILAADASAALGLTLPPLADHTTSALRTFLPANAALANPVDMIATATADDYRRALTVLLEDPGVDSALVLYTPISATVEDAAAAVKAAAGAVGKTTVGAFFGAASASDLLAPVPCFTFPESASRALAHAVTYTGVRQWAPSDPIPVSIDSAEVQRLLTGAKTTDGWLSPGDCLGLMKASGIDVVPTAVVHTVDGAAAVAISSGFPVVLKGIGPTLLHKSDTHAVVTGLTEESRVREAARLLLARTDVTGVIVQPMASGVEILAGVTWHDRFGHAIVCGAGGTLTELLADSACRLTPLSTKDAEQMINGLRSRRLLRGFRGSAPCDETSLRDVLLRLSLLAEACPQLRDIDLNPLFVGPDGARAADIRVRIASST